MREELIRLLDTPSLILAEVQHLPEAVRESDPLRQGLDELQRSREHFVMAKQEEFCSWIPAITAASKSWIRNYVRLRVWWRIGHLACRLPRCSVASGSGYEPTFRLLMLANARRCSTNLSRKCSLTTR